MLQLFSHEACGILAPCPGIKPAPPALEGEVLTIDHQGSPAILLVASGSHVTEFSPMDYEYMFNVWRPIHFLPLLQTGTQKGL